MSSTEMKSYLSLIPISAKVRRRQNRMTILCIVLAVFSGYGGVQYGRYGDSDGNLKPAEQKRKLAYHGKGHLLKQPQSLPHRRMLLHFRRIATSTLPLRKTTLPEINVPHW